MLFETRAGPMRLRWNEQSITAIEMPDLTHREVRAVLLEQKDLAPPPFVREAMEKLKLHLDGSPQNLSKLPLDWSALPPFHREVYELVRELPAGRTMTTARSRRSSASRARRARWGRRWARTPSSSRCRVIACWAPAGRREDFPRRAG